MQTKRLIVIGVSLVVGALITAGIVYLNIPIGPLEAPFFVIGFGTTAERFAYSNVLLLVLSFGGIVFIWLDYFLNTRFLKS
jgi:hypothetical protein